MKTKFAIAVIILLNSLLVTAQNDESIRSIEVNGSAEIKIQPDEIKFIIGIEEYWKEEFEKKKDFEDYKTKIPLSEIEDQLIKNLRSVGIEKEDIVVGGLGNYWRFRGKEFLYSKQLVVNIKDLSKINQLMQIQDAKGIKYMNIGELDHSKMNEFEKEVKIDALKDAKEKAKYLVESIGEELGEVVSIIEMSDTNYRPMYAKSMMLSADATPESIDQVEDITLSYQVRAKFSIK